MKFEYSELGSLVARKIGYGIVQPGPSVKNGIPVIKVNNIISGLRSVSDLDTTTIENDEKYARTRLHGGELLVSVVGTIGKTAIVPSSFSGCNLVRATALIDISDQVLAKWTKYYLDSPAGQAYMQKNLNTTVQPTLNIKSLSSMPIPIVDKDDMNNAVSTLSAIDDKIELNNQINENLQQQAQAIFEERFILSQCEGERKSLYNFANFINGAAFRTDDFSETGLPIIKIAELKNGITDSTQYFSGDKGDKYIVEDKDILFSWSGNPETSIDIFIWSHGKGILNQHTFNVKPLNGRRWFTYLLLKHFKPEFMHIASGKQTTGLGHVTAADLKRLTFVWNEQAMDELENEIAPMMELLYNNMLENKGLAFLRDSLLEKLMTGENDIHI